MKTNPVINNLNKTTSVKSRSLKDLYPEKYQEYLNSEAKKYRNSIHAEIQELSSICKEHADYRCELCGDPAIDAHHIIPLEEGGPNTLDNLICVCRSCHRQIHKGVYKFDENLKKFQPVINPDHIIPDKEKPKYIQAFEDMIGTTLYRYTKGYYAFVNGLKVKYDVKGIKMAVGYTEERNQINEEEKARLAAKKQLKKEIELLKYLKKEFKAKGDTFRWHQFRQLELQWETIEEKLRSQILDSVMKYCI